MKIALTFDDGPDGEYTDEILDILDEYDIKATFFVIGKCCKRYPSTLKRIYDSGHEIGNHTYSHPHLSRTSLSKIKDEIEATDAEVYGITGMHTGLFRPPEGFFSDGIGELCEDMGYKTVLWSVDTEDWRGPNKDSIVQAVNEGVYSGAIILCHDHVEGESNTPEALRELIPKLLSQGYVFVTVSELLAL